MAAHRPAAAADCAGAGFHPAFGIITKSDPFPLAIPALCLWVVALTAVGINGDGQITPGFDLTDQRFDQVGRGTVDADHLQVWMIR